jgi:uncharacterized damage-inducible protein DinB
MDLRYPVGKFEYHGPHSPEDRNSLITSIEHAPDKLREAIRGLKPSQMDTAYRPGGWTVRQVVHHIPDSHMNAYIRFKLALTETEPVIKPYDEARWANLADSTETPVEVSFSLLESLHHRWVILLRSLQPAQFDLKFTHPERGPMSLDQTLALYAWHGDHHIAHITALRNREGWAD